MCQVVDRMLEMLPQSFARTGGLESAMGPALQAAFLVMNHIGGKLLLFQVFAWAYTCVGMWCGLFLNLT